MLSECLPEIDRFELLLFLSPEKRCLYGLPSAESIGEISRLWVVEFLDYDRDQPDDISIPDNVAIAHYRENRNDLLNWAGANDLKITRLPCCLDLPTSFDSQLGTTNPFAAPVVVDISCAPRGRLFALLAYLATIQRVSKHPITLMYSLVQRQAVTEEAFSYGMQDVVVVPGFTGQVRLRKDLLILVMGFEGNRAFSLYRRLNPNRAILILGDSGDKEREFYLKRSRQNNYPLLNIHGNEPRVMSSRDPELFAEQLDDMLRTEIEPVKDKFNVYLSCLGTKLQAVGAFLALRQYPYIQVIDALPSRRRIASEGERQTLFWDLGTTGLIRESYKATKTA